MLLKCFALTIRNWKIQYGNSIWFSFRFLSLLHNFSLIPTSENVLYKKSENHVNTGTSTWRSSGTGRAGESFRCWGITMCIRHIAILKIKIRLSCYVNIWRRWRFMLMSRYYFDTRQYTYRLGTCVCNFFFFFVGEESLLNWLRFNDAPVIRVLRLSIQICCII